VEIVKMFVLNSLCGFRESKKTDKYIVELATRAQDPEIRALAVEVLNEYHKEVQAAQNDPENQELMRLLREERAAKRKKERERIDAAKTTTKTIHENSSEVVDESNIVDSKRTSKRPERFVDIQWSDGGTHLGTISDAERRAREELIDEDEDDHDDHDDHDKSKKDFPEASRPRKFDPWVDTGLDAESNAGSDSDFTPESISDVEEEVAEHLLTDKQRAKMEAKAARASRPKLDEASRQLACKLLDDYERVYTDEDLDEDVHLARALRLIHAKKVGLPFDDVASFHIKVCDWKVLFSTSYLNTSSTHISPMRC
jgi:hypothetical protein